MKAPAVAGKMKEEKNKSATGKKQGTEMAQNCREWQSEKTRGRARVYREVGEPVSEEGTQLDKKATGRCPQEGHGAHQTCPVARMIITPDYCLPGVSSLA